MINDIYTKGFVEFYEPGGLDLIKINEFKLLNVEERARDNGIKDVSPELTKRLNSFAFYIKNKYIDPYWPKSKYNKFIVWDGVDNDNKGWHTDMFEGYDLFFLYYFDDTFTETGGAVQFKWKNGEASIQPKSGTLILVNNCRGFWHRAVSSNISRRVASFDFNVGLETI